MQSRFKERLSYQTDPEELEEFMMQNNLDHDTSAQEPEEPAKQINRQERTPLHDAAEFGYPNFAITFIEHGDDINAVDAKGRTPLHAAVQAEQEEMVRFLIQRGADVNKKDKDGLTPLHLAVVLRSVTLARLLLQAGANPRAEDARGRTPLHAAVQAWQEEKELQTQQEEVVRLLIQRGADVNMKDKDGLTPLHLAVVLRSLTLPRLLLQAGANPRAEDADGHTPFLFAYLFDEDEILELFLGTKPLKLEAGPSSTLRRHLVNLRPLAMIRSML
ncbi:hypothetical protein CNMCM5793_007804 [Aspergillus hiratsukae]|uniref:Uncharacterized protein n=1 Tax=Aspergillus hiratsukae TaxID=1194566 RepID=A0A8H6UAW8_9EURO|nr:hypothetical protein CNMCM5793_007804 [Aspergillus hiratsukae]KAF7157813.1 hypothetical protein CNMCM6106_003942 [Aspergillus hiratsukae]